MISRLRKDAVGWDDPAPVVGKRPRGRPRKKGQVWKLATLLQVEPSTELTVLIYGKEERVQVVWRDVWLRDVTHKVRVVVVVTKREPILLVSTDLTPAPSGDHRVVRRPLPAGAEPAGSEAVSGAGETTSVSVVGHPSVCPSRVDRLLSVAAHHAPGSAGPLADRGHGHVRRAS